MAVDRISDQYSQAQVLPQDTSITSFTAPRAPTTPPITSPGRAPGHASTDPSRPHLDAPDARSPPSWPLPAEGVSVGRCGPPGSPCTHWPQLALLEAAATHQSCHHRLGKAGYSRSTPGHELLKPSTPEHAIKHQALSPTHQHKPSNHRLDEAGVDVARALWLYGAARLCWPIPGYANHTMIPGEGPA